MFVPHADEFSVKRKTCRRYNDPGHAHALTFTCFQRQPFLRRDRTRQWLVDAIEKARETHHFHLWAFVIMPEHVHLMIHPTTSYNISRILSSLKQPVAKRAIFFVRREAPRFLPKMTDRQPNGKTSIRFWQRGGGYDRNLWLPAHIWETIDYIHANPVRRRLCDSPANWTWSSACNYLDDTQGALRIDTDSLPDDPRCRRR